MARVSDILAALEQIAPNRYAFPFDKVGLQIGDSNQSVTKAVVSLDSSLAATEFGKAQGAQLLLSHHPLIFNPLPSVTASSHQGKVVMTLVKAEMSFIAAHTNWDSAIGGINDTLAGLLGLVRSAEFGTGAEVSNLKLVVFAPAGEEERIVDAAAQAGAGVIGAYSRCAFTQPGVGSFDASVSATPADGQAGARNTVQESRIEMVLPAAKRKAVEKAVRKAHSYEEPALDFYELAPVVEQPAGRICQLPEPTSLSEFSSRVAAKLGLATWTWGAPSKVIKKVAFVGGSADGEWMAAQRAGADVLVTGEVKQHIGLEASESGFALIAAGHYATENPGCVALRDRMIAAVPDVEWLLFEPEPGASGRPYSP
jgi:dinuclear metal center YbgI/SA1388 family protein